MRGAVLVRVSTVCPLLSLSTKVHGLLASLFAGWLQANTGVPVFDRAQSRGVTRRGVQTSGASTKSTCVLSKHPVMPRPGIASPPNVDGVGVLDAVLALNEPFAAVVPVIVGLGGIELVGEPMLGFTASASEFRSLLTLAVPAFDVVILPPEDEGVFALPVLGPAAPAAEMVWLAVGVEFLSRLVAEALAPPFGPVVPTMFSAPEAASEAAEEASAAASGRAMSLVALAPTGATLTNDWPSLLSALPPPQALAMAPTARKIPTRRVRFAGCFVMVKLSSEERIRNDGMPHE